MNSGEPGAYDDLLDRLLGGEEVDLEDALGRNPGFSEAERRNLRSLASALGEHARDGPGAKPGIPFEQLGEFRLLRRLGEGSIGMVFLAEQPSLGRQVAVKVLRPGLVLSDEADARLSREAQAIARLRHPNVVSAFSFGQDRGIRYLAMEHVEGVGLDEVLAAARAGGHRPSALQLTAWCRDVARGLQAAHEAAIVHRDVKPSNIRITPAGQAVLLDFGLALDRPDSTLTTAGAFRGSPRYSSPEQIDPRGREIDARTDVYSLGVTLYEAVTLRPPFEADSREALFARILRGDPDPPRKAASATPRELETVILTAIERDRDRRYQTAAAFAADLDALLELRDILARPPGLARRVRKWVRRRTAAAAVVAAAILALLTAAGVLVGRRIADRRAFAQAAAEADAAAGRGAFDDALAAWDRAIGLMPGDADARARRAATVALRDRSRAEALLAQARDLLARARSSRAEADAIEKEAGRLREEMSGRTLSPGEGRVLARGEGRARPLRLEQEASFHEAVNRAHDARALLQDPAAASAVLADIYLERWREALASGDPALQRAYAKLVFEHDRAGAHREELDGTGSVAFDVAPEGAEVFLFRYEEQADVIPDGERRLVPVPVDGAPTPVPPGTWCLRPLNPEGGLGVEDLVFEMNGRRIEGTLFVLPTKPGIDPLDVLVSVDGREIDRHVDLAEAMSTPSRKKLVLDGKRGRYEVEAASLDELAAHVGNARLAAGAIEFDATIWSDGVVRRARIPKGLRYRCTAAPLFLSPGCRIGHAPVDERELPPGSYLAYVRREGFEPQRLPFVVERAGRAQLRCALRPAGTVPNAFRYVPAGEAMVGRPHAVGTGSIAAASRHVGGFAILDREVTVEEFIRFLNADVNEELKRPPEQRVWNRTRGHTIWTQTKRAASGRFEVHPAFETLPASGISFVQAEAYAWWMTAEAAKLGKPVVYAIPTDLEWEKAARGADGRPYPYGWVFHALWQKHGRSTQKMTPEKVQSFPVDESPYGVFDMMGSQLEWCDRSAATQGFDDSRTLRGAPWSLTEVRTLFQEWEFARDIAMAETGFRIVIRDVAPESRPTTR